MSYLVDQWHTNAQKIAEEIRKQQTQEMLAVMRCRTNQIRYQRMNEDHERMNTDQQFTN